MFPERPQRHGNDVCGLLYGQMGGQLVQEDLQRGSIEGFKAH